MSEKKRRHFEKAYKLHSPDKAKANRPSANISQFSLAFGVSRSGLSPVATLRTLIGAASTSAKPFTRPPTLGESIGQGG